MSLASVRPLCHLGQLRLSLARGCLHGRLECFIERDHVRQGLRGAVREAHVAQVVDRHAGADDDDVLVAQSGHGLAEAVVLVYVRAGVLAYLNDGDVEGVLFGMER